MYHRETAMNRPTIIGAVAITIAGLSAAGILNAHNTRNEMESLLYQAEQAAVSGQFKQAKAAAEKIKSVWDEKEKRLLLYIRHNEIDDIGKSISELKYLAEFGDSAEFCSKLDQTKGLIYHVWESELPLFKNIL